MADLISREQYEELDEVRTYDRQEYHKLLEEYVGIVAEPYTGYSYYDSAGNYLGDSDMSTLDDLLEAAYVEVSNG